MPTPVSRASAPMNYGVADVARECCVPVRRVSDLYYQGRLDGARCPVVAGRRLIPADYVPVIRRVLASLAQVKVTKSRRSKGETVMPIKQK